MLLKALGPRVARKIGDRALRAAARPIVNEAKRLVRLRTGELRRSLTVRTSKRANRSESTRGVIIASAGLGWRAGFLEFGTAKARAFPFLRPAMDSKSAEALTAMGRILGDGIDKEAQALDRGRK